MAAPGAITFNTPVTANSMALRCTTAANAVMDLSNAALLPGSTAGTQLGDFLRFNTYADAAAVDTAFRNILGEIVIRQTSGTAGTSVAVVVWVASASTPALQITAVGSTDSQYEILIRTSHSVIR